VASAAPFTWSVARFRSTVVGEYELRVFASEVQRQWWGGMQRDNLPGAPLTVTLSPAAADHQRCTVNLAGLKERPGGMIVGMAGREATLTVVARDRFNNPATFAGQRLRVDAVGPADVMLNGAGSTPSEQRFTGTLAKSGSYTLRASVAGRSIAGFPRNLQVVAAQTDPMQCQIRGDALTGVVVGDMTRASLTAHDRFSNACLEGGDQVLVRMLGPAGSVDADVVDYGDGTYGLTFTVPRAGEWRAHLAVNGDENPNPVARFTAAQGRLTANQGGAVLV
jgi:filamin